MRTFRLLCSLAGCVIFTALSAHGQVSAPGARIKKLADGFLFTEGPACDADGNVYFTDQPNNRILKWNTAGQLSTFLQPAGRANGLCFDKEGNLWACADEKNELWRITRDRKVEIVLKTYARKALNGPNDLWLRPGGGIYFTDPYYQRDYWTRTSPEQDKQCVYFLSPGSKAPIRVAENLKQPNGIIGTPDGRQLYVADIGANKTYRYTIAPDGALSDQTLFCQMGSDGMTIDERGDVYLTNHGVTIFDPAGKEIEHIDIPDEKWTGNVCFGGTDRKTLFITASKGLYAMPMSVAGVGSQ